MTLISTIEEAVAVLNERKWRHFDTWRKAPKFSVAAWDTRFDTWAIGYCEQDAIAIANSLLLAERCAELEAALSW